MIKPIVELINLIESNSNWRDILTSPPCSIKVNPHPVWKDVYVLSYNMFETKWDPIRPYLLACRGLMIRVTDHVEVLAYGFDKFFNIGESHAADINWTSAKALQKVDGSLIKRYYAEGSFRWMLNNAPTADAPLPDTPLNQGRYPTFESLIEAAPESKDQALEAASLQNWTLLFELVSPFNTIVIRYPETHLWLLGARRNVWPYEELGPEEAKRAFCIGAPIPRQYDFSSWEDLEELLTEDLNDGQHEGIVVCDSSFHRVKMKAEAYVKMHGLKDGDGQMTTKRLWACVNSGVHDDVVSAWPEFKERVDEMVELRNEGSRTIVQLLKYLALQATNSQIEDLRERRKDFAMLVTRSQKFKPISSLAFTMYNEVKDPKTYDYWSLVSNFVKGLDYDKFKEAINDVSIH
jgi:T4 RnlA family RNA ligase